MNRVLVILTISFCVGEVTKAFDGDANVVAASQFHDQEDLDTSDGPAADATASSRRSAASDDVNCTLISDVTAARRSLCPAKCSCLPLDGHDVWTKLTVNCSGKAKFDYASWFEAGSKLIAGLQRAGIWSII